MKPVTIADVRADKDLGVGSCSIYDEAHTDEELQEVLDRMNREAAHYPGGVLVEMRRINEICLSRMMEQMDGWRD